MPRIAEASKLLPEPEEPARKSGVTQNGTLYLRLPGETDPRYPKVKAMLNMFPGQSSVVLYFADTKQRRGTRCVLMENLLKELKNVLGEGNVVIK